MVRAEIQLEDGGNIELELYPDIAPKTVANFVKLANENFYDGLVFHRVIKDFMIQGGGYDTDMTQHETDTITGEFLQNGSFNMIPHERGVISMARTAISMDSASSQFFIMHQDSPSLNGQYASFGKVTSGMEYVDKIAETETHSLTDMGMDDVPVQNQIIKTIVIK
ncbi:MAG: peptidylprolyl isomerase [Clostridia bacterium]|uniref:peptidylprolyl isomerase n=1 Tax=Hominilimicola sp. TaxID=3073571 RepID=UPI0039963DAA